MQPTQTSMYTTTTSGTAHVAMKAKPISGPHFQPNVSESASAKADIQMIATCGVLNRGWVRASGIVASAFLASAKKTGVAAFTAAFEFAASEFRNARKTTTQPA